MLLRFGIANHHSILDYQEVLLTAAPRIGGDRVTIPAPTVDESALTVAAIYGANASGKSNLLDALSEFKRAVLGSHTQLGATDPIPRSPFLLDPSARERPTQFDCTFVLEGSTTARESQFADQSVYEYGFEYTDEEIQREWLSRTLRKKRRSTRLLFERETRDGRVRLDFGDHLQGENRTIANLTRPNSLFLSAAAQNNHPQLTDLYRFFTEQWQVYQSEELTSDSSIAKRLADFEHREQLLELVLQAGVGITGGFSEQEGLQFVHAGAAGANAHLKYDLESKGTRRLISLLIPALEALSRGALLVVDELDTSLHPFLARAFVSLFSQAESNPRGAQLVFSTHDVTLLGRDFLLQDQIWLADKNSEGASIFTPMSDFRLRSRDNLERAYRHGRFGGVGMRDEFFLEI